METLDHKPCPRVLIAGAHSGVGKTSVTLALINALVRRGLRVQPFKVGPDYLDPTYLSIAAGRPCYNLDGWMMGRDYVEELFANRTGNADVAVIEGVMGLFDGSDPVGPEGSTAEIAQWLDCPVLLVVNVHGLARSVAALVKGYASFDPAVKIAGVICNRSGSEGHGRWLAESLAACGMPPQTAAIPRGALPELPSRHLGLITAHADNLSDNVLNALGDALEAHGSVDRIIDIARQAPAFSVEAPRNFADKPEDKVRLGVARDAAFHFYYKDNLEALERAGCELVEFSPVSDSRLPANLDGLYMGGGYPEEHANALSENRTMLGSVRDFAESGRPVYAECGGLMYLSQGIECLDGKRYELVGLLPSWTLMLNRLRTLGYAEITLTRDSLFGPAGSVLRGHEFHYSQLMGDPAEHERWSTAYSVKRRRGDREILEGFQRGNVLASYVHVHFASKTGAVEQFVSTLGRGRKSR